MFSAEDDAIRLTTIHASKGLDFQATIVLDLAASERMNAAPLRFTRADEIARLVMPLRGPRGLRLDSAIARAENMEARARARSERSRISYVAITRARRVLGLIGSTKERASGSWLETFGAVRDAIDPLHERLDAGSLVNGALARDAVEPLASAALPAPRFPAPPLPAAIAIATTPLGVFAGCPRRFRLRFLLGLEEPIDTGQLDLFELDPERVQRKLEPFESEAGESDPRVAGRAAHRVLERTPVATFGSVPDEAALVRALVAEEISEAEAVTLAPRVASFIASRYAATLPHAEDIMREHEILLSAGDAAPRLWLRGTVDLAARFSGRIDVIDYKLARAGDMQGYAFQLRAYGLALAKQWHLPVRAGIVFLGSGGEPQWLKGSDGGDQLTAADHEATEGELLALTRQFAEARARDVFPGVPVHTCHRLHCGFVAACHPDSKPSVKQVRRRRAPR